MPRSERDIHTWARTCGICDAIHSTPTAAADCEEAHIREHDAQADRIFCDGGDPTPLDGVVGPDMAARMARTCGLCGELHDHVDGAADCEADHIANRDEYTDGLDDTGHGEPR